MKIHIQLARYAIVGLFFNTLGYLLYLAITALGMEPKLAMTLLYIIGTLQTFFFNRKWSFSHDGAAMPSLIRYLLAYASGYVINWFALYGLVDILGYPHQIIQGLIIFAIAAYLFFLQKFWVFAPGMRKLNSKGPT